MKRIYLWMTMVFAMFLASCQPESVKVAVVATSDLEGALFSYDFKNAMESRNGLTFIANYLKEVKGELGDENVIFVDNGDLFAGWPMAYYLNRLEKNEVNIAAEAMNLLGCEVYGIGEGELSQGRDLLNRHAKAMKGSAVCANLVDAATGKPVFKPYTVVERNGVKCAFVGIITEEAVAYLSAAQMEGLKITDCEAAARDAIAEIKKNENPDVIIGLMHMGASSVSKRTKSREDMAQTIARNVAGFDAIVCGHDGMRRSRTVESIDGKQVVLASPGRRGSFAVEVLISGVRGKNGIEKKSVNVDIKSMLARTSDKEYVQAMRARVQEYASGVNKKIASVKGEMKAVDALFGPSAYVDIVHAVQLQNTGADLSIAHPYTIQEVCVDGEVSIADMRRFYPVGGKLYTVTMKGSEIYDMLLHSLSGYYMNVYKKNGNLLKYNRENTRLSENCKSLESVAGLRYNVHVNKKKDEGKLQILGLANGQPFKLDKEYTVAVSADYLQNANLAFSIGAKIKQHELRKRVVAISEKDLTELILDYFTANKTVQLKPMNNWSLQPAAWMKDIKENEMKKITDVYFPQAMIDDAALMPAIK